MDAPPRASSIRLREPASALLGLPWEQPLADWTPDVVRFVELPVGPSRHLVRFIELDREVFGLKELPLRPARQEYEVLRELEAREIPSVRAAGLAERPAEDAAILVTRYLERSFQFRRLFMRLPEATGGHRERLLDAMANLLVELHRNGVYWGDGSLANTLLVRDGQTLQAHLVDAETSEIHPLLSDGQRAFDLEVAVENVAGDLADLGGLVGRGLDELDEDFAAASSLADRYRRLWDELYREDPLRRDERWRVEARIRRLNELGFVVDEVMLAPGGEDAETVHLKVAVGSRHYHAERLRRFTGLEVGEGQAAILINDLAAWAALTHKAAGAPLDEAEAARRWLAEVYEPTVRRLRDAMGSGIDPVQAYCDLLEVRWLLSERAGHDVGDEAAMAAMVARRAPPDSAAGMAVAESPTGAFAVAELLGADPEGEDRKR